MYTTSKYKIGDRLVVKKGKDLFMAHSAKIYTICDIKYSENQNIDENKISIIWDYNTQLINNDKKGFEYNESAIKKKMRKI